FWGLVSMVLVWPLLGSPFEYLNSVQPLPRFALSWLAVGFVISVLYYALCESQRGATLGKFICRLRVAGPDDSTPDFARSFVRALIYLAIPAIPHWLIYGIDPQAYLRSSTLVQQSMSFSSIALLAILFSTFRRRNGFAAMH